MTFGQEPHSAVAAKAQLAARSDQPGHFYLRQTGQAPVNPVPALRRIRRVPRHRLHVLLGETSLPFDDKGAGRFSFAGSISATALSSFGALDKDAARLVFKGWPFVVATYCGGVELVSDALIIGHARLSS